MTEAKFKELFNEVCTKLSEDEVLDLAVAAMNSEAIPFYHYLTSKHPRLVDAPELQPPHTSWNTDNFSMAKFDKCRAIQLMLCYVFQ